MKMKKMVNWRFKKNKNMVKIVNYLKMYMFRNINFDI